jgi:hypothetical protein
MEKYKKKKFLIVYGFNQPLVMLDVHWEQLWPIGICN